MKSNSIKIVFLLALIALIQSSCRKDSLCVTCNTSTCITCNTPNRPPKADAGRDQIITIINAFTPTITLNGSHSTDPDRNIAQYEWKKIAGPPSFNIADASMIFAQVTDLIEGIYQFELQVTDKDNLFSKDTVQVTVNAPCDNSNRPEINMQLTHFGNLSRPRGSLAMASAGNKILFAGGNEISGEFWGSSRVDIYDLASQSWSTAELSKPRFGIAVVAAGNKILFAGGETGDGDNDTYYSTVDIYDVVTNTWSVSALSEPRSHIGATVLNNTVFFAGGEYNYVTSARVDMYEITTGSWTKATLSEPRSYISAVAVNNKIYFAGGQIDYNSPTTTIDIYDPINRSWTISELTVPMGSIAGIAANNQIYWTSECTLEIRHILTGSSSITHLSKSWVTSTPVIKNNKMIFPFQDGMKFDIYDMITNTWYVGVLNQRVAGGDLISVNNEIYIAGGSLDGRVSDGVYKLGF